MTIGLSLDPVTQALATIGAIADTITETMKFMQSPAGQALATEEAAGLHKVITDFNNLQAFIQSKFPQTKAN